MKNLQIYHVTNQMQLKVILYNSYNSFIIYLAALICPSFWEFWRWVNGHDPWLQPYLLLSGTCSRYILVTRQFTSDFNQELVPNCYLSLCFWHWNLIEPHSRNQLLASNNHSPSDLTFQPFWPLFLSHIASQHALQVAEIGGNMQCIENLIWKRCLKELENR